MAVIETHIFLPCCILMLRVTLLLFPLISSLVPALPEKVLKLVCLVRIAASLIAFVSTGFTATVESAVLLTIRAFLLLQLKAKSRLPAITNFIKPLVNKLLLYKALFDVFLFIYFLFQHRRFITHAFSFLPIFNCSVHITEIKQYIAVMFNFCGAFIFIVG